MKIQSQKLNSVAINKIVLDQLQVVEKPTSVNHIFCCDVSYSMVSSLSKMRQQLKNRIPDLIGENDSITIIWFSGRNQAGILKEGVRVNNVSDLQNLNNAIDRFLVPIGATSFLDPVILSQGVADLLIAQEPDSICSFIFLTDGYNNDCPWQDVISNLEKLESKVAASTFIEYGYYANSDGLSEMAETLGGQKIFSKDFDSFEMEFEKQLTSNAQTTKRYSFDLSPVKDKMQYAFLFTINDNGIVVYGAKGKNEILIPEGTESLYFFSEYSPSEYEKVVFEDEAVYASVYVLADKMKYKLVDGLLSAIGDVNLQEIYTNSYGKQKLNDFKELTKSAVFDPAIRFKNGKFPGKAIKQNAYCFINMIDDLMSDDENMFFPYHPDFNYNRIGAKSITKTELTQEVKDKLSKAKTLKEVEVLTESIETPEFVYPENQAEQGQSFANLVWNESRANLSINTRLQGKVKLPSNNFGLDEVDSFIYRSYTFIKDGVLNVTEIPVKLSEQSYNQLASHGLLAGYTSGSYNSNETYLLNFSKLPTINRKMATTISAKELAKLEYDLLLEQNRKKYLDALNKEVNPKTNIESAAKYSPEIAQWLKDLGISDYNGFSPKTEKVLNGDVYVASHLETKIKGYSSIPSINEVQTKIKDGKTLNASQQMLADAISEVDKEMKGMDENAKREYLSKAFRESNTLRRRYLSEIAQIKFGVILSRTWFKEFEDFNQNTLAYQVGSNILHYIFDFSDKEIKL